LATQIYGANKENAAASYAAQQAVGQGVSDIGQATSGALMGVSGAYGQLAAAKGASSVTGAGGQQYVPATSSTGGQYYKLSSPIY
jgi:hypothetical protein